MVKRISYRNKDKKLSIFDVVGIVSTALLVFVSAFYILAPAISSHAEGNTKVTLTVSPVVSISVDAESIDFDITPTPEGVFESKQVTASVLTNSSDGYELYFSSVDNETDLISQTVSTVIPSDFNNTVTSLSMPANNWGYSMNGTDFSKIPALNAQATLKNIDHYPTTEEKTTTVNIGVKIDTNIPSGAYAKSVVFSAVAHETPPPISTMQSFSCSELSNVGDSTVLTDTRDGNSYTVKKLADGNCWMTENLRIAGKTITSADSNVASDFTIPASSTDGFNTQDTNNAYVDSTYGGYYTFYTATAGTGGTSLTSGNAPSSICPKGWRLPTGGSSGEFNTLYGQYNSAALMMGVPNFTLAGYVYNGSVYHQGSLGYFWSSTVYSANNAYDLILNSSDVNPVSDDGKNLGFSVRCAAI